MSLRFCLNIPVFVLILLLSLPTLAQSPAGHWLVQNERSVIHIQPCENQSEELCGNIHWIIEDGMQYDTKNPEPALQDRPLCGLQIMRGFEQQSDDKWVDGKIYKADDGDTYNAVFQILPTGKLLVRGYIGFPLFGKSQKWTRVNPENYPQCETPTK